MGRERGAGKEVELRGDLRDRVEEQGKWVRGGGAGIRGGEEGRKEGMRENKVMCVYTDLGGGTY